MGIKRHIPNVFTACNVLSGCIGISMAFEGQLVPAALWLWTGAVFDFLDGLMARLLKSPSEFGKQLDSLADVITFGLLPSSILYQYLQTPQHDWLAHAAWALALFSALRLAKFNIDTRQTQHFIGLPTPAAGIFVSALPLIEHTYPDLFVSVADRDVLFIGVFALSFLLVSPIPMMSLKFTKGGWADNRTRIFLVIASIVLLLTFGVAGIPIIIVFYVVLSLILWTVKTVRTEAKQP